MTKTLDLVKKLIRKSSITPEDKGCQEIMINRIKPLGFDVEIMSFGDVQNFYAKKGNTSPLIVFAGHTDVVPPGPRDEWKFDPFVPTEDDATLYGRGAADMKSSLAAFVVAVEEFVIENPNHLGSIGFLITSDEEGIAIDGTVKVVEALIEKKEQIDYCIVGEPTSSLKFGDTVKNGRRGSLSAKLVVNGVQGHIAYPELIRNPIHEIAPAIDTLVNTVWDEGNEYFPKTSWQISNINGGTGATNVVPGKVEVLFNFRYSTSNTADALKTRVIDILDKHKLDYTISWNHSGNPYLTEKGMLVDTISASIEDIVNVTPSISTTGGTSDGRFISTICDQVVEFGPINKSIHKINEHININDIELLKNIYKRTLEKLLKT
jgi:succinyl-diaminopimelate desuccinylase